MKLRLSMLLLCTSGLALSAGDGQEPLRNWLLNLASHQLEARRSAIDGIATREQAQARGRQVRAMLLQMIGGLPEQRTPLNLRRSGIIDRGQYRIEKLVYESLPQVYVTANLYVPQTGHGPYPAVLQPTGHSPAAKARATYQTLALGLVNSGFVVLTYDPLGQGERRLFYDSDLGDSKVGGPTQEHGIVGVQSLLAGESVARYMVWDGIRSIDVLASLPEVDHAHIGVAGCSGGGTLTAYLAAIDDRLQAAAPACYVTAWEEQLAGTGPQDAEQQFPDQLKNGLSHADFALAFAPRPYLQVNTTDDFFPIAGARRAFNEAKRIYGLFGAAGRTSWAVGPGGHGMPKVVREAIYGWMDQWLRGGPPGPRPEPAIETEYEESLYCTPTGQVSTSLGGENASTLNMRRYSQRLPDRAPLTSPADLETLRAHARERIRSLTRFEAASGPLRITEEERTRRTGYLVTRLTYGGTDGRAVPALLAVPDAASREAVLLVTEEGIEAALQPGSDGDVLARLGHPVLALDVAGFGRTAQRSDDDSDTSYGPEKIAWLAMMTGRPLVGLGVADILRGLDLLQERKLGGAGCIGFGKGLPGVAMLHAAALDTRITKVIVEGALISYHEVARTPIHQGIIRAVVPGVLGQYDLPDLAACLAPRPLTLASLRTPTGQVALSEEVHRAYQYALSAYVAAGAADMLAIRIRREDESVDSAYPRSSGAGTCAARMERFRELTKTPK